MVVTEREAMGMTDAVDEALAPVLERFGPKVIPAIIGVAVGRAVEAGGCELVKSSLTSAVDMADEMQAAIQRGMQ